MRPVIWIVLGWCCAFVNLSPALSAAQTNISVQKAPVALSYQTYPPGHPPPHPDVSSDLEAGLCEYRFGCTTSAQFELPRFALKARPLKLDAVKIELTLEIIIWTAEGSGPRVLAHEETHRAIAEQYYQRAEIVARAAALAATGHTPLLQPRATEATAKQSLQAWQQSVVSEYMAQTHERCTFAEIRFDEITDHSRANVSNAEAMTRALQEEETHWRAQANPNR